MRLSHPFQTVLRNVCCLDEHADRGRNGVQTPCFWDVALRRGLDRLADMLFAGAGFPRRRHLDRPRMAVEESRAA